MDVEELDLQEIKNIALSKAAEWDELEANYEWNIGEEW